MANLDAPFSFVVFLGMLHYSLWEMPVCGQTVTRNLKRILAKVKVMTHLQTGVPQVNKIKHGEEEQNHPTYSVVAIHKPHIIRSSKDEEDVT